MSCVYYSGIIVCIKTHYVRIIGREVKPLTATEIKILYRLIQHPGKIVTGDTIEKIIEGKVSVTQVANHVRLLRNKLFPNDQELAKIVIRNSFKQGYYIPDRTELCTTLYKLANRRAN